MPVPVQSHEKINGQRFSRLKPRYPLREAKLKRLDAMCSDEFDSNGLGLGAARAAEPDTFGIRFRNIHLPTMARRGNSAKSAKRDNRKPPGKPASTAQPDFGWDDGSWSHQYYLELEKAHEQEQFGTRLNAHYEELDNCEFQYDRIARAHMATTLTDNSDDDTAGTTPVPRTSGFMDLFASSKEYARAFRMN